MSALTMSGIDRETLGPSLAYSLGLCFLSEILQAQSIPFVNEETFRQPLSKQQYQFGKTSTTAPNVCLCSGTNHPVCMNLF